MCVGDKRQHPFLSLNTIMIDNHTTTHSITIIHFLENSPDVHRKKTISEISVWKHDSLEMEWDVLYIYLSYFSEKKKRWGFGWLGMAWDVKWKWEKQARKAFPPTKLKWMEMERRGKWKKPGNFSTYIKFIQNIFQIYLPKNTRVKAIPPKTMGKWRKEKVNDSFWWWWWCKLLFCTPTTILCTSGMENNTGKKCNLKCLLFSRIFFGWCDNSETTE